MPTVEDLDVLGDWVAIVTICSDDLFVFFARESGRIARRPLFSTLAARAGFLAPLGLIEVGNCIWSAPPLFGWLIDLRMPHRLSTALWNLGAIPGWHVESVADSLHT